MAANYTIHVKQVAKNKEKGKNKVEKEERIYTGGQNAYCYAR